MNGIIAPSPPNNIHANNNHAKNDNNNNDNHADNNNDLISLSHADNLTKAENSGFWEIFEGQYLQADLYGFLLVWMVVGVKVVSGCLGGINMNYGGCSWFYGNTSHARSETERWGRFQAMEILTLGVTGKTGTQTSEIPKHKQFSIQKGEFTSLVVVFFTSFQELHSSK